MIGCCCEGRGARRGEVETGGTGEEEKAKNGMRGEGSEKKAGEAGGRRRVVIVDEEG